LATKLGDVFSRCLQREVRRIVAEVPVERLLPAMASSMNFKPKVVHRSVEYQPCGRRASSFAISSPFRNSSARGCLREIKAARGGIQTAIKAATSRA